MISTGRRILAVLNDVTAGEPACCGWEGGHTETFSSGMFSSAMCSLLLLGTCPHYLSKTSHTSSPTRPSIVPAADPEPPWEPSET